MSPVGPDTQRVDVRVLERQQVVVLGTLEQRRLQRQRLGIGDAPQTADPEHGVVPYSSAAQSRDPSSSATRPRKAET